MLHTAPNEQKSSLWSQAWVSRIWRWWDWRKKAPCCAWNTTFKKCGGVLCKRVAVRYAVASALWHLYPVRLVCLVLYAPDSGYYARLKRDANPLSKVFRWEAEALAAHKQTRDIYGAERLHQKTKAANCRLIWRPKLTTYLKSQVSFLVHPSTHSA